MVFHRKYSSESDKGGFLSVRLLWKLIFPLPRELNKKAPVYTAPGLDGTHRWRRRGLAEQDSRLRRKADRKLEEHTAGGETSS